MRFSAAFLAFAASPRWCEAACKCAEYDGTPQAAATNNMDATFVNTVQDYGFGCKAHDENKGGQCLNAPAQETADGKAKDWCLDQWCIVNVTDDCTDMKLRDVSYTERADDQFSYELCDDSFAGNSWVGFCKNCESPFVDSFCTCGGAAGCECIKSANKVTPATIDGTDNAYVGEAASYGYGCKAHDAEGGACKNATDTKDGEPNDWCLDAWCVVDPATCDLKTRGVSYSLDANDYFSYETCDTKFKGNSWVGFCKNCEAPYEMNSFCTCGGLDGCKCIESANKVTPANLPGTDNAYVGEAASYGYGCKAHDAEGGACANATHTAFGHPNDWCQDKWCVVDRTKCDLKTRGVSYSADGMDYFSYETCDDSFKGNSWVGYCRTCTETKYQSNSFCECGGLEGCKCKGGSSKVTPANIDGTDNAYVGEALSYGYGCKAHDAKGGSCATAKDTANGQPNDWCLDQWCVVDLSKCDLKTRGVSYSLDANDYFSYETCNNNFKGNSWVGFCKNCEAPHEMNSFCTCGGRDGCECIKSANKVTAANIDGTDTAYVGEAASYGYGCKAHDAGHGSCGTAKDTGVGQPNDWCLDKWCVVDKSKCDLKTRAVSYSATTTDYFSYETCDENFKGNGWVGRCKSCESPFASNSYCTCPKGGSTGGDGDPDANLASRRTMAFAAVGFCCILAAP